jgi:glycosyltransferase involved in cell wall biosynthesis
MRVAWISEYPVEWAESAPDNIRAMPKQHPATWLRVLAREFSKRNDIELHAVAVRTKAPSSATFKADGINVHVVKVPPFSRSATLYWADTVAISRLFKSIRPDLVHAWGSEKGAGLVASRLGYPYLVTIQGLLSWYRQLIPFNSYDHFSTEMEDVSLRRARVLTTECRFAAGYLRNLYPDAEVIQAEHAPNWHFHNVQRQPQLSPFRFIFVGTPGYRKGTDLLLLALNELTPQFDFELTVIGGGDGFVRAVDAPLKPEFLRRIRVVPGVPPEEVARELATAGALVLPTRADTSPNAVKEAVVAGVPVVASAIGGVLDYVEDGLNGFRFEAGNLRALVEALQALLRHPELSKGRVDAAFLAKMQDYLSPSRMADNFFNAYNKTLSMFGHQ